MFSVQVEAAVSSSVIVPVAVGSAASVTFDGLDRVSVKVSSSSSVVSSIVATVTVSSVTPGMKVSVSLAAVKSVSEVAVPPVVAQFTVTVWPLAADSVTVKVTPLPSVPEASATLTDGGSSSSSMVMVERVWVPAVAFTKS